MMTKGYMRDHMGVGGRSKGPLVVTTYLLTRLHAVLPKQWFSCVMVYQLGVVMGGHGGPGPCSFFNYEKMRF